ncbi:MAG: hypothetical protein IJI03_21550 [Rudaea sp.]|nr:hypothetical protein [Rudaea sp.]
METAHHTRIEVALQLAGVERGRVFSGGLFGRLDGYLSIRSKMADSFVRHSSSSATPFLDLRLCPVPSRKTVQQHPEAKIRLQVLSSFNTRRAPESRYSALFQSTLHVLKTRYAAFL